MSIEIKVFERGIDHVIEGLGLLAIRIEGNLTIDELTTIGERTLQLARDIVAFEIGALRDSLQMFVDTKNFRVIIGTDGGIRPDGVRKVYGRYVELGTSKMQAQPFLMPSLLTAINEFQRDYPSRVKEFSNVHLHLGRGK